MEMLTSWQWSSSAKLAPGFRFHPTDEELVSYYLKRKILGKGFRLDAIADADVYKAEPWELPEKSKLKSRDLEWYFFSVLDKKYGNGARTNRATEKGYWKTTGKDRTVFHKSQVAGMKKTLVYHHGRAPRGQRTNWVMHEYRLSDESLAKAGIFQDAFVLCRIFQKSGSGPKNGERYGTPLIEEEWEEDELDLTPSKEVLEEPVVTDDNDIYLDSSDLEQIFNATIPVEDVPHPPRFNYGDNSCQVQETPVEESYHALEKEPENQHSPVLQMQNQMDVKPANQEFIGESSNNMNDLDFLLDEPFFDAIADGPFDDLAFVESDDLLNPIKEDPSGVDMLDEYLNFFNAQQDVNSWYMAFDSSNMVGTENLAADPALVSPELVYGGTKQEIVENQQLSQGYNDDEAFVSKQKPENVESGSQYSFIEKASHMLGDISAPPALASEFPTKESALRLASASSSSVQLTAGMIQIRKPGLNGTETSWVHGKNVDFSFVLSFVLSHDNAGNSLSIEQSLGDVLTKASSAMSRGMMYLMFFWMLILALTSKVGRCFCLGNVSL